MLFYGKLAGEGGSLKAPTPWSNGEWNMNATDRERVGPMLNPPHLGELIRESMEEVGWNVTETAAHLGCERRTLSRLLDGKSGVSPNMALALEAIGWGTADHWMRMQASYELAQVRRESAAAGRPDTAQKVVAEARCSSVLSDEEAMATAVRETRRHRAGQND